jgi:hypothetical protein
VKKKHVMPLLLGAGVLYYLYHKSQTPPPVVAAIAPAAPATMAGFGFRR